MPRKRTHIPTEGYEDYEQFSTGLAGLTYAAIYDSGTSTTEVAQSTQPSRKPQRKRKATAYEAYEDSGSTTQPYDNHYTPSGTKASASGTAQSKRSKKTGKETGENVTEEKRLARFRTHCPKTIQERVDRVRSQRFYMIDREKLGSIAREQFKVLGSTGNVYTVTITNLPTCDCPDFLKGNHCKHLLFVYLKILGVKESSNLYYQKALLDSELLSIFTEAPAAPNSVANNRVLTVYAKAVGKPSLSKGEGAASETRRNVDGEDCPVCYEEMKGKTASDLASIVFCETCKNGLHADCFRMYGGYLNLGQVAGMSGVRDTSSYYHGPRKGEPTATILFSRAISQLFRRQNRLIDTSRTTMDHEDTVMIIGENDRNGPKDEDNFPTISTSFLSRKLQYLASLDQQSLLSEVRRLARLPFFNLKREIEAEPRALINKLPPELLAEIFLIGQDLEAGNDEYAVPSSHLVVASVCHSWRQLALSTPLLWRKLSISDAPVYGRSRLWIARSGTAPLQIGMNWTDDDGQSESVGPRWTTKSWQQVYRFIKPEMYRVEGFVLAVDDYAIMSDALQCLEKIAAPELKRLELSHHEDKVDIFAENAHYRQHVSLFGGEDGTQHPPPLSHVRLWGVHVDWSSSMFSNLQVLILAYHSEEVRPSTTDFFAMLLSSAERLTVLTIEASGPSGDSIEGWPAESIAYPRLKSLKLAFLSAVQVQNGLLVTDAPNLQQLHLDMDAESFDDDWNRTIEILCTGGYLATVSPRFNNRKRGQPLFPHIRSLTISSLPRADRVWLKAHLERFDEFEDTEDEDEGIDEEDEDEDEVEFDTDDEDEDQDDDEDETDESDD
ncbi:hypothetical protein FRC17_001930 [Serendipita sp. 399]|nr:hypothetical protein FRC17_001930 [Serendipita sp. 399]